MKFGVFTVSMPEYDINETVKVLSELGYDGVEWRVQTIPDQVPAEIPFDRRYWIYNKSTLNIETIVEKAEAVKALCDAHGLDIFGLTTYLNPSNLKELEPVLQAAKLMGTGQVRVFTAGYNGETCFTDLFKATVEQLASVEALAKTYGIKVVLEIHMDNILASPSAAYRIVSQFDPNCIGVIFDPGNMVKEGFEDYKKSFEMLGPYIAHVHIKNGAIIENGIDEFGSKKWMFQWVPLKKGMADLRKLFQVMKEQGYDGNISVEDFSNEESTYDKLKNHLAYMKSLAKAAK